MAVAVISQVASGGGATLSFGRLLRRRLLRFFGASPASFAASGEPPLVVACAGAAETVSGAGECSWRGGRYDD